MTPRISPVLALLGLFGLPSTVLSAGKELEGERAAALSVCPSPEEAARKMSVPQGYEVRCFAHEPMVVNPVAMTWDQRGRLWVVEGYEYPNGSEFKKNAFGGEAKDDQYHPVPELCQAKDNPLNAMRVDHPKIPKDRIIILEDSDNDGIADKRTVFLEGLDMGSAILLGDGGVYVGQQPHLLHFKDTDGDDHADEWRVVLTGFGREDTHELLNSFCWGPDGWLYMTHGVFTNSRVRRPGVPLEKGFKFDAGIGRARPQGGGTLLSRNSDPESRDKSVPAPWEFEVFADGTSNPWGCDYDARGNFFVSACVIDHFFHMAPGGLYVRQGGAPENPYAYELLPSIVEHKHFRAAYAGVQIYQGSVYPQDTWGHAFIGNIHDNAVHEEILTPVGATFKCEPRRDFLRANDGWFRPVSTQTGPDGNLWIMDWCDKYPCYQNAKANPEGVDREKGRIWRVVWTGGDNVARESLRGHATPAKGLAGYFPSRESREMDLSKLSTPELIQLLKHDNNWVRRMARRQLVERDDPKGKELLEELLWEKTDMGHARLEALWALLALGAVDARTTARLSDAKYDEFCIPLRMWAARAIGEFPDKTFGETGDRKRPDGQNVKLVEWPELVKLASDPDASVRLAAAIAARQHFGVRLTTNAFRPLNFRAVGDFYKNSSVYLRPLIEASARSEDSTLPFAIWMLMASRMNSDSEYILDLLAEIGSASQPLSRNLASKSMRRLCDTRDAKNLDLAVDFIEKIQSHDVLLAHALDGLEKGQESGVIKPTKDTGALFAKLLAHPRADVRQHAQNLATLWGDPGAIRQVVIKLLDPAAPEAERVAALQTLRKVKNADARAAYAKLMAGNDDTPVVIPRPTTGVSSFLEEALRAASDLGGDGTPAAILALWQKLTPAQRAAAAEALVAREAWASSFLDAINDKRIPAGDVPMTVHRALAMHRNPTLKNRAGELLGRWHESPADIKALIAAKRKACLEGEPDLAQGKIVFTTTCAVCHSFHGGGQKVGPDLIGSGRSNLDALLANLIDPNQIIGNGYENIVVTTKDNRTVAGRLVEDTPNHVKLLAIAGAEQIVARDQVASLVNTHQSVMPMGFGALPDDVFRNLIWYVLAPPEEGPLTKEKKKLLSQGVEGAEAVKKKPAANSTRSIDWESISLWNPQWKVEAPDFERTPIKLAEFHGRTNVLLMHPFAKDKPCALERKVMIGAGKLDRLSFFVAAHDQGDWELRVKVDGEMVRKETIGHEGERWKRIEVELARWAGKEITLRLEGAANGWSNEFGYWSDATLK